MMKKKKSKVKAGSRSSRSGKAAAKKSRRSLSSRGKSGRGRRKSGGMNREEAMPAEVESEENAGERYIP
jgi:hypothetical protein